MVQMGRLAHHLLVRDLKPRGRVRLVATKRDRRGGQHRRVAPARWLALILCLASVVGCGGDDRDSGGNAPPPDITLDAYAAHNDAVEVQERWQESKDPDAAGLCSEFYESPELAEGLRKENPPTEVLELGLDYQDLLGGASAAQMEAADACAEGTELQPWHDDELEDQLAAREETAKAQEEAAYAATADLIDVQGELCSTIDDELGPKGALRYKPFSAMTDSLARELETAPGVHRVVPKDVDLDDVAWNFVFACSEYPSPERAAAAIRNPDTPTDEGPDDAGP